MAATIISYFVFMEILFSHLLWGLWKVAFSQKESLISQTTVDM